MTQAEAAPSAAQLQHAFDAVAAAFERAAGRCGVATYSYRVAGLVVRVEYAGDLARALAPGLEHLEVAPEPAHLVIRAFDSASTGEPPPLRDDALEMLIVAGMPAASLDSRIHGAYRRTDSGLRLIDEEANTAFYWVPATSRVPAWERAAPFRGILSHWMPGRGRRFVHGAAVGAGGAAVLIVGRSGSGKSTTALTCLASGMDYAGDDYCLVDVATLRVFPLYRSAKLHPANLARVPWLAGQAMNEGDLMDKLVYFPAAPGSIPPSMRIAAIILPRITANAGACLSPATGAAALAAIAPTTLLQLSHADGSALRDFARLAKSVPVYALELGDDMERVPDLLRTVLGV